jgi:hypothetical protein
MEATTDNQDVTYRVAPPGFRESNANSLTEMAFCIFPARYQTTKQMRILK